MSQLRVNFLNWRPDLEPAGHDGLVEADNVLHGAEGYKPLTKQTTGSFATTAAFSTVVSVVSIQIRPIGIGGDLAFCILEQNSSLDVGPSLRLGLVGQATAIAGTSTFPSTMLSARAARIVSFSVAELENHFVMTAEATGELQGGTTHALNESVAVRYSHD